MYLASIGGFALLFLGGESLVRGAVGIARRLRISPLVIGLTIVAFGTSAPELIVSLGAAQSGRPDLALGNVVGSCIANIALILGLSSVIRPLRVDRADIRPDLFAMLGSFALLALLTRFAVIGRAAGALMIVLLAGYLVRTYLRERSAMESRQRGSRPPEDAAPPGPACELALDRLAEKAHSEKRAAEALEVCEDWRVEEVREVPTVSGLALSVVLIVAGLIALVWGADLLVEGASEIAKTFGVPPAVIGLTVVALGTSLPELTTSVVATLRRHGDVAIGNVLGSNVFNILAILGVTAIVAPVAVASRIASFDVLVMLVAGIIASALLLARGSIGRIGGIALFVGYLAYVAFLYLG
jgi:cation:H+ antiporter